jgi:hypothetical protein
VRRGEQLQRVPVDPETYRTKDVHFAMRALLDGVMKEKEKERKGDSVETFFLPTSFCLPLSPDPMWYE